MHCSNVETSGAFFLPFFFFRLGFIAAAAAVVIALSPLCLQRLWGRDARRKDRDPWAASARKAGARLSRAGRISPCCCLFREIFAPPAPDTVQLRVCFLAASTTGQRKSAFPVRGDFCRGLPGRKGSAPAFEEGETGSTEVFPTSRWTWEFKWHRHWPVADWLHSELESQPELLDLPARGPFKPFYWR